MLPEHGRFRYIFRLPNEMVLVYSLPWNMKQIPVIKTQAMNVIVRFQTECELVNTHSLENGCCIYSTLVLQVV